MRNKDYRRREEAKHFKARKRILSNGNLDLLESENLSEKEERKRNRLIHKIKTGDLKYGMWNSYDKKLSNKTRRMFQKTVDYKLPNNRFLNRQDVNPQAKGYDSDSENDYLFCVEHDD